MDAETRDAFDRVHQRLDTVGTELGKVNTELAIIGQRMSTEGPFVRKTECATTQARSHNRVKNHVSKVIQPEKERKDFWTKVRSTVFITLIVTAVLGVWELIKNWLKGS